MLGIVEKLGHEEGAAETLGICETLGLSLGEALGKALGTPDGHVLGTLEGETLLVGKLLGELLGS